MARKRLFVGSVFAESPRNATWYELQCRYLRRTLGTDYVHAIFLNRVEPDQFDGATIVGEDRVGGPNGRAEHARGLDSLLAYFRARSEFEDCLIIDSDAFPFRDGWLDTLLGWMNANEYVGAKRFAAAVRTENLDTFPHPCVFFAKGDYLRAAGARLSFAPTSHTNLAGYRLDDVGCGVSVWDGDAHVFFPLLRTNRWNPHPVLGAVYGDLFYHHGAGSRTARFRAEMVGYFANMLAQENAELETSLFQRLEQDPDALLAKLAGS